MHTIVQYVGVNIPSSNHIAPSQTFGQSYYSKAHRAQSTTTALANQNRFISPARVESPYARAKHPDTPLIFHANGGVGKLAVMKESKADVIGLDWETSFAEARAVFGPDRVLQGNMDPMYLFASEVRCTQREWRVSDMEKKEKEKTSSQSPPRLVCIHDP